MFADNLRTVLRLRGKTQKELAEYIGVKPNTVSDWLQQGNSPKIEHLCRISEYLNISLDWLLKGEGTCEAINVEPNNVASETYTEDEKLLIDKYRDLNDYQKDALHGRADRMIGWEEGEKISTSYSTKNETEFDIEIKKIG